MLPFKTVFIINPTAGRGRAARVWRRLELLLHDARQHFHAYYTRCRNDATAIAEKARALGAELIVGVGGDGTLLEVVNGLDLKKNIFGIIPAGTGNGFYRSLKIPGNQRTV
ncbi:MAG: acylglycerol kinase family protein, partial [Firmicutes bacterium]|nr:acylglycerol kinase family protein [Bacillota bacterium]